MNVKVVLVVVSSDMITVEQKIEDVFSDIQDVCQGIGYGSCEITLYGSLKFCTSLNVKLMSTDIGSIVMPEDLC